MIQTKTSQLAAIQLQLQDVTLKADSEKSHREQLQHQLEMTETQVKQISSERVTKRNEKNLLIHFHDKYFIHFLYLVHE